MRGLRQDDGSGLTYQLVAWSALLAVQWVDPGTESWMLFFVLYPQMWAMVRVRLAAAGTLVTLVAFGVLRFVQSGFDRTTLGPILVTSLVVGFAISLFQAMTQIQEFTLAFVPKVVAVGVALIVSGNWMLHTLMDFTIDLFDRIPSLLS